MEDRQTLTSVRAALATASTQQVGDLGEETAGVHLETVLDATIVAIGDSGMPRTQRRQDLDVVAAIDDQLIVFEVKSTPQRASRRSAHPSRQPSPAAPPRSPLCSRCRNQAR